MIFGREPVLVLAAINAVVALGVSFGLGLSADQTGAISAATAAILGFVARRKVTPDGNA